MGSNAKWVPMQGFKIPPGAVKVSQYPETYVARAMHGKKWFPGFVDPVLNTCSIMPGKKRIVVHDCEVLCDCTPKWLDMRFGCHIPIGSLSVNPTDPEGEHRFFGKLKQSYNKEYIMTIHEDKSKNIAINKNNVPTTPSNEFKILVLSAADLNELSNYKMKEGILSRFKNLLWRTTPVDEDELSEDSDPIWVDATSGTVPSGAIVGGSNHLGDIFVARVKLPDGFLPGKFIPNYGKCFVSVDGQEKSSVNYQVLCNFPGDWVPMNSKDNIPIDAITAGKFRNEEHFVGRVRIGQHFVPGKVRLSDKTCYYLLRGKEEKEADFQILVAERTNNQTQSSSNSANSNALEVAEASYKSGKKHGHSNNKSVSSGRCSQTQHGGNESKKSSEIWVQASNGAVPAKAFAGGKNKVGAVYVARLTYGSDIIPGKLIPTYGYCYVGHNGMEVKNKNYEVLCTDKVAWIKFDSTMSFPQIAVFGGQNSDGNILYIGRVVDKTNIFLGKVSSRDKKCYVVIANKEHCHTDYELLVHDENPRPRANSNSRKQHSNGYSNFGSFTPMRSQSFYTSPQNMITTNSFTFQPSSFYAQSTSAGINRPQNQVSPGSSSYQTTSKNPSFEDLRPPLALDYQQKPQNSANFSEVSPGSSSNQTMQKNPSFEDLRSPLELNFQQKPQNSANLYEDSNFGSFTAMRFQSSYNNSPQNMTTTNSFTFQPSSSQSTSGINQPQNQDSRPQLALDYQQKPQNSAILSEGSSLETIKKWIPAVNGEIPPRAVEAAFDTVNGSSFIARAEYQNMLLPGVLWQNAGCYVIYNNNPVQVQKYEVLCNTDVTSNWAPMTNQMDLPDEAMACGFTDDEQNLFIGLVREGTKDTYLGIVEEDDKLCRIIKNGKIETIEKYEILMTN